MAGNGPFPTATRQPERDTKRHDRDVVTVVRDVRLRGTPGAPDDCRYDSRRVAHYDTWCRLPEAQVFADTTGPRCT